MAYLFYADETARLFITWLMNSLMVSLFLDAVNYTRKNTIHNRF